MRITHAVVDAVDGLVAPLNLSNDAALGQSGTRFTQNSFQDSFTVPTRKNHVFAQNSVATGIVIEERQFLQFAENGVEPQAVRDRHVNFKCFLCNSATFFRTHHSECTKIVQTVGKLHENHTHIATHGKKHLAKALSLSDFVGRETQLIEFAYTVNEFGDFHAEALDHFNLGHRRIFKHVMHQTRTDRC